MKSLLRFWFTFERPVSRAAYMRSGFVLAILKYGGDVAIVGLITRQWWSPFDYVHSLSYLMAGKLAGAPVYVAPLLALWTAPFLWIGVTMTMRRALDAGLSGWCALLFFIPYVNYLLIGALAFLPTRVTHRASSIPMPVEDRRLPRVLLLAIGAGLALGLAMVAFSVLTLGRYGLALFMGTPFGIGACTSFLLNRRATTSRMETLGVVTFTICLVGGSIFLVGGEGVVCLAMALPLAVLIAAMGGELGRALATQTSGQTAPALLAALVWPATAFLEPATQPALHEVRSTLEIRASPDRVWQNVIAFPPLTQPHELAFRLGIAYPQSAHIDGTGAGATRYCVFSTGAFVEPITRWERGKLLSFDVSKSPPPLRELTFYSAIAPPHLDGYMRPTRGEFRLIPLAGGATRLEGTTWYELRIEPEVYWTLYADYIVRKIHRRVLEHIKQEAESSSRANSAAGTERPTKS